MRDVIRTNGLIIAADNSGAIGEKEHDAVRAPYEVVGYFSARVALMECMAAGGEPFAAVLHNFSGDAAWKALKEGVQRAAAELGCALEVTGSTESNFSMLQSAAGMVIIGRHAREAGRVEGREVQYGVIGKPLVGKEVLECAEDVAPLAVFREIIKMEGVRAVLPVGSKGIAHELEQLSGKKGCCELDMKKSAGPSTCFLVAFEEGAAQRIEKAAGRLYRLHLVE
ncbi:ATP-binding protein [Domibacillus sp.]|uniref:ATP-binding protein n=1 Tax=Domibacillus sp. TaxID=1969783 RepID=UPI0028118295|nr:ATP-binding protein [Domibacillus sp.]